MDNLKTKTLTFGVNELKLKAIFERELPAQKEETDSKNYHFIHDHINYELFFIINGQIELIAEEGSRVFKGSVLMIPPKYGHFTVIHGEVFPFFISFSKHNSEEHALLIERKLNNGQINEMPMTSNLLSHIGDLAASLRSKSECADQRSVAYLELIFSDIFEHFGIFGVEKVKNDKEYAYFSVIESFVNEHYADGCSLAKLADRLHLSVRQTSRVVNKLCGEPFTSIMNNKRLAIASVLLKNTDKPISLIAVELGYANESNFFTNFKKKYSLTPLQYRKSAKNGLLH